MGGKLQEAVRASGAQFAEVEAAITLLYELGEGANEEMAKPSCGTLGQLVRGAFLAFSDFRDKTLSAVMSFTIVS